MSFKLRDGRPIKIAKLEKYYENPKLCMFKMKLSKRQYQEAINKLYRFHQKINQSSSERCPPDYSADVLEQRYGGTYVPSCYALHQTIDPRFSGGPRGTVGRTDPNSILFSRRFNVDNGKMLPQFLPDRQQYMTSCRKQKYY
jgi:hypothetical protein